MNINFKILKLRIIITLAVVLGVVYVFFLDIQENDYLSNETIASRVIDNDITFSSFDITDNGVIDNKTTETESLKTDNETKNDIPSFDSSGKININTATENMLITLPSIGKTIAKSIIEYRETNGPFTDISQIKKVKRIGDKTFEKIKNTITVG